MEPLIINYSVFANPQKDEEGRTTYQVRQDIYGVENTEGVKKYLKEHQVLPPYLLDALIDLVKQQVVYQLFLNHRLHLTGFGTFFLNIGLKPVKDENGKLHKRVITDPAQITGNDVEVTGIGFIPDKEFQEMVTEAPLSFIHSNKRGVVGHTAQYTRKEIIDGLLEWIDGHNFITRRVFQMFWQLTYYSSRTWLKQLSEGDNPPLMACREGTTIVYRRNPAYQPE